MFVPENFQDRSVCVMGLGYVGLTLAVVMADVGFDVLGVEIRPQVVKDLRQGKPHFYEPGLEQKLEFLAKNKRLRIEEKIPESHKSRIYIITVGTPLSDQGTVRLEMISAVAEEVSRYLRDGDMVIMRSTVKVGATRKIVVPILDKAGVDYELAFCPERTIEGKALSELRQLPQIVGGAELRTTIRAAQLFQFLTPTVVRVHSLETAEMIKLVDNSQRDVFFAFSNEVARMCDAVGISATEVISAGKLGYPRTNLAMPGPVGGPCLEKDTYILAEAMNEFGVTPEIALTSRRLNERQPLESVLAIKHLTNQMKDFPSRPVICLMGLAFKGRPATDDLRGTMAFPILNALRVAYPDAAFKGYDPHVSNTGITTEFGIEPCENLADGFAGSSLVVIANNHPCFKGLPIEILAESMAGSGLVYDFWNSFDPTELTLPDRIGFIGLGGHGTGRLPEGVLWNGKLALEILV